MPEAEGRLRHHGLNVERNPLTQDSTTGGPGEQSQEWPVSDQALRPQADHSEQTYRGGGKLEAAIHNFTRSLAFTLSDRGIRVNCVAPGPVWTPLIPATRAPDKVAEHGAGALWKRPAQPAELAPTYVFLASTDSRYYSGEVSAPTGMQMTSR